MNQFDVDQLVRKISQEIKEKEQCKDKTTDNINDYFKTIKIASKVFLNRLLGKKDKVLASIYLRGLYLL